jgi:hypothetical protein
MFHVKHSKRELDLILAGMLNTSCNLSLFFTVCYTACSKSMVTMHLPHIQRTKKSASEGSFSVDNPQNTC